MINLNTVDLQLFEEKKTIDRILTDLKIGWWKVDHEKKGYVLSDIAVKMLKLDSNIIRFKTFTEMIREDYRARIMKEIENIENQYLYDQTFPIQTPSGEIWLRSKIIHKETDEKGNSSISGFIQIIPNPEVTQPEKASLLRINNLLYQLNTISHTLLSFLQSIRPIPLSTRFLKISWNNSKAEGLTSLSITGKKRHKLVLMKSQTPT